MITIHHLGISQSDRIVWLMEELGLPYKLKWYQRKADGLAPDEFLALHPAATAPVIEDDGLVLPESAAIVEYICRRHANGRLTVGPDEPGFADYLYWLHFNNNIMGLFIARRALEFADTTPPSERMRHLINRRETRYFNHLNERLGKAPYLAGTDFTCADIMVMFPITTLAKFGGRTIDDLPNVVAYVQRIRERPAYATAMTIAGPEATVGDR